MGAERWVCWFGLQDSHLGKPRTVSTPGMLTSVEMKVVFAVDFLGVPTAVVLVWILDDYIRARAKQSVQSTTWASSTPAAGGRYVESGRYANMVMFLVCVGSFIVWEVQRSSNASGCVRFFGSGLLFLC